MKPKLWGFVFLFLGTAQRTTEAAVLRFTSAAAAALAATDCMQVMADVGGPLMQSLVARTAELV